MSIISQIKVGTLVSTKNEFLKYPCRVAIHVFEGDPVGGYINQCTVNTGNGGWVTARRAKFIEISNPQPEKYQHFNPFELLSRYDEIMSNDRGTVHPDNSPEKTV